MKALIGIGDSWTQGEGGYPEEVWKANNGRMWKPLYESKHLIPIEQENSWVNRLAKKINHTPVNLGQRGMGNRGAVRSLYLQDYSNYNGGAVVFLLSGFDRFDFFNEYWQTDHYKFQTLWPHLDHKDEHILYTKYIYKEKAVAVETACCIIEAQNFAIANGFEFVFGNCFELRGKDYFDKFCPEVSIKIPWDRYIHSYTDYSCFAELLVIKDGLCDTASVAEFYPKLDYPAKHMTNDIHPTIEGYKVITDEIKRIFF